MVALCEAVRFRLRCCTESMALTSPATPAAPRSRKELRVHTCEDICPQDDRSATPNSPRGTAMCVASGMLAQRAQPVHAFRVHPRLADTMRPAPSKWPMLVFTVPSTTGVLRPLASTAFKAPTWQWAHASGKCCSTTSEPANPERRRPPTRNPPILSFPTTHHQAPC